VIEYLIEENRVLKDQMQGKALRLNDDQEVARSTIAKVLKENGVLPAPDRPTSWRAFLRAHWGSVAAMNFLTAEVWTPKGLETQHVLFAIDLATRRVEVVGITPHPTESFMAQVGRSLLERMIFFGRRGFQRAVGEYVAHYNEERHHQGIDAVPVPRGEGGRIGRVRSRERLGGLLRHYSRAAA
jgi:transposase InsO family protein